MLCPVLLDVAHEVFLAQGRHGFVDVKVLYGAERVAADKSTLELVECFYLLAVKH